MKHFNRSNSPFSYALLLVLPLASCNDEKGGEAGADPSASERNSVSVSQRSSVLLADLSTSFRRPMTNADEVKKLEETTSSLSDENLRELLREFSPQRNSSESRGAFVLLVSELARRDPEAAIAMFDPTTMSVEEAGWYQVAGILAESNPLLIQTWLLEDLSKGPASLQKGLLHLGVDAMIDRISGAEMVQFYQKIPKGSVEDSSMLTRIFNAYAQSDAEGAEKTARELLKGEKLDMALQNIAMTILSKDPDKAFQLTGTIQDQERRKTILAMQYRQLAEDDLPGTMARLQKLDQNLIEEIFRGDDGFFGESVTTLIAKSDPEKLVNLVGGMTVSGSNQAIFERAVSSLTAAGKPELALQIIEAMPEGGMQSELYRKYVDQLVINDPTSAISTFSELPAGKNRSHAFGAIGQAQGQKKGFEETIGTMNKAIPEGDRSTFLNGAMPYLIDAQPDKVRAFLNSENSNVLQPEARSQSFERLGSKLTATNPTEAQKWLSELPENDQTSAMKGFSREMVQSNLQGLVEVLSDLPRNETWANGVRTITRDLEKSDPGTATEWQNALEEAGFKK